ncbi:MAG TPA: thioesterase domain-containing protein [Chloroflexia bacterium]|nr:thioesterase domain-containing protein [Chloroflexia bacterium]
MEELLGELQSTLNAEIPLTRALGVRVLRYENATLELSAPLQENINHKDTAFAGSLNALATLAGWSLLWLVLKEAGLSAKIVIQDSSTGYLLPVTQDFSACCSLPEPAVLERFIKTLTRKGIARLELTSSIIENGKVAVSFKGRYVAQASK